METYIYAVYMDGESKYDERNQLMNTDDPLFPFLKNCLYGPMVTFINSAGNPVCGIQLIDYAFYINNSKLVIPLAPGTIVEGPIKKMNLQETNQIIYEQNLPLEVFDEIDKVAEETTTNEECVEADQTQVSFGSFGDEYVMFQQEDIELEEEIVSLQSNEEERPKNIIVPEKLEYKKNKKLKRKFVKNKVRLDQTLKEYERTDVSSDENDIDKDEENVLDEDKKELIAFSNKNLQSKLNKDVKDVATALVNFSSINNQILMDKKKVVLKEKIMGVKSYRKKRKGKFKKQSKKLSKLKMHKKLSGFKNNKLDTVNNFDFKENIDLESETPNILNNQESLTQNIEEQVQVSADEILFLHDSKINKLIDEKSSSDNISNNSPIINEEIITNNIVTASSTICSAQTCTSLSEYTSIINQASPLKDSLTETDISIVLNEEKKLDDVSTPENIIDSIGQTENINYEPELNEVLDQSEKENSVLSTPNELESSSKAVYDLKPSHSEPLKQDVLEQDDINIDSPKDNASVILVAPDLEIAKINTSAMEEDITTAYNGRFIYAMANRAKTYAVKTTNADQAILLQRLKHMEDERAEMRENLRRMEERLQSWEADLSRREKSIRCKRNY